MAYPPARRRNILESFSCVQIRQHSTLKCYVCSGNPYQCCGSRSEAAWIRIDLALLDPDPYWDCPDPGARILTKQQQNLISSLS
jgi:hypothetical protein